MIEHRTPELAEHLSKTNRQFVRELRVHVEEAYRLGMMEGYKQGWDRGWSAGWDDRVEFMSQEEC